MGLSLLFTAKNKLQLLVFLRMTITFFIKKMKRRLLKFRKMLPKTLAMKLTTFIEFSQRKN